MVEYKRGVLILLTAYCLPLIAAYTMALARWTDEPKQNHKPKALVSEANMPICTAEGYQQLPSIASDEKGNTIIVWQDTRNIEKENFGRDIYAQKINAEGEIEWEKDGIPVCTAEEEQERTVVVSDGAGGAIIVWSDLRLHRRGIYAQRISANGTPLWEKDGVPACNEYTRREIEAVPDGAGGTIITWEDWRNGNQDIYAQRLGPDGKPVWAENGVPVCKAEGDQYDPFLVADGKGGAIFTWWDTSTPSWNVYTQRLDAQGNSLWGVAGIAVCDVPQEKGTPFIVEDGNGGAFIVWVDYRYSAQPPDESDAPKVVAGDANGDIYVQRISADGIALFPKNGISVCNLPSNQQQPTGISDGTGGIIITWWDERDIFSDIYAQQIDRNGKALWEANGVSVCAAGGVQRHPVIVPDGAGGAIILWKDYREDYGEKEVDDIYAQRISTDGKTLWEPNGVPVSTADGRQDNLRATHGNKGSAIVVWSDSRNGEEDIYAQMVGK